MNERIKQLAQQSELWDRLDPARLGISTGGSSIEKVWGEELQEFAQLIVAECVEQILTGVRTNPPQAEPPELVQTLVRRIQRHFGVGE